MLARAYHTRLAGLPFLLLGVLPGCNDSPPSPPIPDAAAAACSVSARTTYDSQTKVITGTGTISCNIAAELSLKVCLYGKNSADVSWGIPIQCSSSGGSGRTTLSAEAAANISIGGTKEYRTTAEARVDSVDQPTQNSAVVTAP